MAARGRALREGNAEGRGGGRTALGETEEDKEGERRKKERKERWLSADPGGSRYVLMDAGSGVSALLAGSPSWRCAGREEPSGPGPGGAGGASLRPRPFCCGGTRAGLSCSRRHYPRAVVGGPRCAARVCVWVRGWGNKEVMLLLLSPAPSLRARCVFLAGVRRISRAGRDPRGSSRPALSAAQDTPMCLLDVQSGLGVRNSVEFWRRKLGVVWGEELCLDLGICVWDCEASPHPFVCPLCLSAEPRV